jgi:hypothetical protein
METSQRNTVVEKLIRGESRAEPDDSLRQELDGGGGFVAAPLRSEIEAKQTRHGLSLFRFAF